MMRIKGRYRRRGAPQKCICCTVMRHLFADGAVINRADVSKFGLHVGRITLTFIKPDQKRPVAEAIAADVTPPPAPRP